MEAGLPGEYGRCAVAPPGPTSRVSSMFDGADSETTWWGTRRTIPVAPLPFAGPAKTLNTTAESPGPDTETLLYGWGFGPAMPDGRRGR